MFLQMYPDAKLLIVEPKSFTPKKRQDMLRSIRDNDYDAVIVAYSCFELVPMSREYYEREIETELSEVNKAIGKTRGNPSLEKRRKALEKKLSDTREALQKNIPSICFDDLGINTLFLDEAHNYKNISIETKIDRVLGIRRKGSKKCDEMLDKVRCVQRTNNGRGVVFATGTPITNSVTDVFVMQTYLQYGELRFLDLHHFDNWAATFGEKATDFEIDVDTNSYRLATRFSKFHNLPELTNLLAQVADFHKVDETNGLPDFDGYSDKVVSKTKGLAEYLESISARADLIRSGMVARTEDNMLKLTGDGRKAALDMRLADPRAAFTRDSKVYRCAENVLDIHRRTADKRLTQLVFCDTSTPKAGFNV
jgi:N12 class adenine-specific DNA methylase